MAKHKRTAREIKVGDKLLGNKKLNIKIGTIENRDAPETIYIFISFWLDPKEQHKSKEQEFLKSYIDKEFQKIYNKSLKPILEKNSLFPKERENIYIKNIPDNFNYNNKRNFISIELYLHTCNIFSELKYSLNSKKDTELFDEAVKISNIIGNSEILKGQDIFEIYKTS